MLAERSASCNRSAGVDFAVVCRVREYCIQKGLPWDSSMAHEICTEQDYDDELIRTYKTWARVRSM